MFSLNQVQIMGNLGADPGVQATATGDVMYFCNCGLADIDPELEQFAVNSWCSAQGVGTAHLENELANVRGNLWPAHASTERADGRCDRSTRG